MDLQFTASQPTVRILPTTEDNIDLLFVSENQSCFKATSSFVTNKTWFGNKSALQILVALY